MPVFALKQFQQKPKKKIFFRIFIFDSQLNNGKATFLFEPSSIVWQKSSAIQYISVTLDRKATTLYTRVFHAIG